MKRYILAIAATAALLVGCQGEVEVDTLDNGIKPQEVIVEVLSAEQQQVAEVTLEAKVTQGEEAVDDATMKFEVWESGMRDMGTMVKATLTKDGIYTAPYTFEHDGVYYMYAHTDARGMHIMPKQEIMVGNPDMSKVLEDTSSNQMEDMPASHGHGKAEEATNSCEEHNHDEEQDCEEHSDSEGHTHQ